MIDEKKLMEMLSSFPNDVSPNDDNIKAVEIIKNNFREISEKGKEDILPKLVELCKLQFNTGTFIRTVLGLMAANYNDFPKDIQDWFLAYTTIHFGPEVYIDDGTGERYFLDAIITDVIAEHYHDLPKELQSRFIHNWKSSKHDLIRYIVIRSIIKYYDNLPKDVQKLVSELPDDNEVLSQLSAEWQSRPIEGFSKIPVDIQNRILDNIKNSINRET